MGEYFDTLAVAGGVLGIGLLLAILSVWLLRRNAAERHRKVSRQSRKADTSIGLMDGDGGSSSRRSGSGRRRRHSRSSHVPRIDLFGGEKSGAPGEDEPRKPPE